MPLAYAYSHSMICYSGKQDAIVVHTKRRPEGRANGGCVPALHGRYGAPADGLVDGAQQLMQRALLFVGRVRVCCLQGTQR